MDIVIQSALRQCREFSKLNSHKLALAVGLTTKQIELFEGGDYPADPRTLLALAIAIREGVEKRVKFLRKTRAARLARLARRQARMVAEQRAKRYRKLTAKRLATMATKKRLASEGIENAAGDVCAAPGAVEGCLNPSPMEIAAPAI